MAELAAECERKLAAGIRSLDVVEHAVAELESSGMYVAGRGSAPNSAGYVELDASIMDGRTRDAGAVAAVVSVVNPIKAARRVMDDTPHVMLVSKGAREFATQQGLALVDSPDDYYVLPVGVHEHELREQEHGTVGAVALDKSGGLAGATSTGGTFGKLEGRVGDSPLIGQARGPTTRSQYPARAPASKSYEPAARWQLPARSGQAWSATRRSTRCWQRSRAWAATAASSP